MLHFFHLNADNLQVYDQLNRHRFNNKGPTESAPFPPSMPIVFKKTHKSVNFCCVYQVLVMIKLGGFKWNPFNTSHITHIDEKMIEKKKIPSSLQITALKCKSRNSDLCPVVYM